MFSGKFFEGLKRRIEYVSLSDLERFEPVGEGETLLGKPPDDLLRLYILASRISDQLEKDLAAHEAFMATALREHDCTECKRNAEHTNQERHVLTGLFWTAVRVEFPDVAHELMSIRKGGILVLRKPVSMHPLHATLLGEGFVIVRAGEDPEDGDST